MDKAIKEKYVCIFRINLENNINKIPPPFNNRFNDDEETFLFGDKSAQIFGDDIAKNCKINEKYFSFLEKNIEDPNKTEKNMNYNIK